MFKIIKTKEYNKIKEELSQYKKFAEDYGNKKQYNFESFLKEVLGREIRWIDTSKMSKENYQRWYKEAQVLLESEVVRSLLGYQDPDGTMINGEITKDLIEHIAMNTKNFDEVMNSRMKIVGIELLKQYLNNLIKVEDN